MTEKLGALLRIEEYGIALPKDYDLKMFCFREFPKVSFLFRSRKHIYTPLDSLQEMARGNLILAVFCSVHFHPDTLTQLFTPHYCLRRVAN